MVINTNLSGTGGTPPAKPNGRTGANSKTTSPADSLSGLNTDLNSQIDRVPGVAGLEIQDSVAARESVRLAGTNMLQQSAKAMLAQANLTPETALRLLQD